MYMCLWCLISLFCMFSWQVDFKWGSDGCGGFGEGRVEGGWKGGEGSVGSQLTSAGRELHQLYSFVLF